MFYIPRNTGSIDGIWSEDALRSYTTAIPVELYIKNVEGFQGESDFLSKFNLQIRDQITFTIARRTFANEIGAADATSGDTLRERPQEGDLIYFPLNKKIFEIRFVEHESIFYQLGSLQVFDLKCELFEYSNEYFNTGIAEVDRLMTTYTLALDGEGILTEDGFFLTDEEGYALIQEDYDINSADATAQNDDFETVGDSIIDFTERDPFSEGTY